MSREKDYCYSWSQEKVVLCVIFQQVKDIENIYLVRSSGFNKSSATILAGYLLCLRILWMDEMLWNRKMVKVYVPESVTWTIFQQVVDG